MSETSQVPETVFVELQDRFYEILDELKSKESEINAEINDIQRRIERYQTRKRELHEIAAFLHEKDGKNWSEIIENKISDIEIKKSS